MVDITMTEVDVSKFLIDNAKLHGDNSPRTIVVNRTVTGNPERTLQRTVRVALITNTDNESLVDALIQDCLAIDNAIYFVGSDVNLQSEMQVDYLFFEAKIMAKK